MSNSIKRMIPRQLLPVVQKIFWKLFKNYPNTSFTREHYNNLNALKCRIAYNKYGGYCIPESSQHRPAAKKIISNYVFEPETIKYMRDNCGDGDIVHAGTYFGDFLPALSSAISSGARVWAFEPNPENYRCARITLEINNIDNVNLMNAGLGKKKEILLVKTADENGRSLGGGSQILSSDSKDLSGVEEVQIVTIDDVVGADRDVSILQLDVEGHEQEALSGAMSTIQRCLPIIILEVLPSSTLLDSDWFSENILKLGYRKVADIHENTVFSCKS